MLETLLAAGGTLAAKGGGLLLDYIAKKQAEKKKKEEARTNLEKIGKAADNLRTQFDDLSKKVQAILDKKKQKQPPSQ